MLFHTVALFLNMMVILVSAGPLPQSPNSSSHEDENLGRFQQLPNEKENSTRFNSHQYQVNATLDDIPRMEHERMITYSAGPKRCVLSLCILNELSSRLQGGDETAGDITTNPLGFGKK